MMIATPAPSVQRAPTIPAGAASQAPTKAPAGSAPAPTTPTAPASPADDAAQAAAKQEAAASLIQTSAVDALKQVDEHLAKVSTLTVGGGTPQGVEQGRLATALLTDASMLLQHAHIKTLEQIRTMAADLQMDVMTAASGLAFLGGQVAVAGQSEKPVPLAQVAAAPFEATKQSMAALVAALASVAQPGGNGSPAGPTPSGPVVAEPTSTGASTPPPTPNAQGTVVPRPKAPNGNTGIVAPTS